MTPQRREQLKKLYNTERDELDATLVAALCEDYRDFTGKEASDRMRDEFAHTVRYS